MIPLPKADEVMAVGAERRRSFRFCCKLRAARVGAESVAFKPSRLARVVNISRGGIAIHVAEPFDAGTVLTVRLYASFNNPVSATMEIRVLHRREEANGTWVLGAEFVQELADNELQTYLA